MTSVTLTLVRFTPNDRADWLRVAARWLPPAERDHLHTVSDPDRQVQHAVGRALIRRAAAARNGCSPHEVKLAVLSSGKPEVLDPNGPQVSVAHSGGVVALAECLRLPVGVDVEPVRLPADGNRLAERRFAASERQWLRSLPRDEAADRFTCAWTIKEAVGKALGVGIFPALSGVVVGPGRDGVSLVEVVIGPPADRWSLHQLSMESGRVWIAVAVPRPGVSLGGVRSLGLEQFSVAAAPIDRRSDP